MTFIQKISKSNSVEKIKTNAFLLNCSGLFLLLMIFSICVWQANISASYYFKINELKNNLSSLTIENEYLNKRTAEMSSIAYFQENYQNLEMVKVDQLDYLIPTAGSLAQK
jgi:hypothetical protein